MPGRLKIKIVGYHRIFSHKDKRIISFDDFCSFSIDTFKRHLNYYLSKFKIISIDGAIDLINKKTLYCKPLLVLTFDDGDLGQYNYALPVLKKKGISAAFYINDGFAEGEKLFWFDRLQILKSQCREKRISDSFFDSFKDARLRKAAFLKYKLLRGIKRHRKMALNIILFDLDYRTREKITLRLFNDYFGKDDEMKFAKKLYMGWEHLKQMRKEGMTIGSHTTHHKMLTHLDKKELEEEIGLSRKTLQLKSGGEISHFAYPYGSTPSRNLSRTLHKWGFRTAVTGEPGLNDESSDVYRLRRYIITKNGVAS